MNTQALERAIADVKRLHAEYLAAVKEYRQACMAIDGLTFNQAALLASHGFTVGSKSDKSDMLGFRPVQFAKGGFSQTLKRKRSYWAMGYDAKADTHKEREQG